jgi:hypothetical protein
MERYSVNSWPIAGIVPEWVPVEDEDHEAAERPLSSSVSGLCVTVRRKTKTEGTGTQRMERCASIYRLMALRLIALSTAHCGDHLNTSVAVERCLALCV